MALPKRKQAEFSPEKRWRSDKHRRWVTKTFCCAACGRDNPIQAAHVNLGTDPGMGIKTDDWRVVPLCGTTIAGVGCHQLQHNIGESTFWADYKRKTGQDVEQLITDLCKHSPASQDILRVQKARGL